MQALLTRLDHELRAATAAHQPPPLPEAPLALRWQARRVSSLALDAPLLDLLMTDLDGDGQEELLALTSRELLLLRRVRGNPKADLEVAARATIPAPPAARQPRVAVGTLAAVTDRKRGRRAVAVRTSAHAHGVVFTRTDAGLVPVSEIADFPLCADASARLAPGRHYFAAELSTAPLIAAPPDKAANATVDARADAAASAPPATPLGQPSAPFLAARCRPDLRARDGQLHTLAGVVSTAGALSVTRAPRCPTAAECPAPTRTKLDDVGAAFAFADLDRDGRVEIAVARATAPGDSDQVSIFSWRPARLAPLFQRRFLGGIIALAAGDLDGREAPVLIAAVRLLGAHRVDLWQLNQPQ